MVQMGRAGLTKRDTGVYHPRSTLCRQCSNDTFLLPPDEKLSIACSVSYIWRQNETQCSLTISFLQSLDHLVRQGTLVIKYSMFLLIFTSFLYIPYKTRHRASTFHILLMVIIPLDLKRLLPRVINPVNMTQFVPCQAFLESLYHTLTNNNWLSSGYSPRGFS